MKKFKFRLEVVRQDRERLEKLKLREWTIVNRMMMELKQQKTDLERRHAEAVIQMTETKRAPVVSTAIISEIDHFISGLKLRISWKASEIQRAEKFVERKRIEWMAARQKREVIDRMKEKKREQFKDAAAKLEDKQMDDLNIMWASHRVSEEDEVNS